MNLYVFAKENEDYKSGFTSSCILKMQISGKPLIYYVINSLIVTNPEKIILLLNEKTRDIISLFPNESFKGIPLEFWLDETKVKDLFVEETECLIADAFKFYGNVILPKEKDGVIAFCEKSDNISDDYYINVNFDNTVLRYKDYSYKSKTYGCLFSGILYFDNTDEFIKNCDSSVFSVYDLFDILLSQSIEIKSVISDEKCLKISDSKALLEFQKIILNNNEEYVLKAENTDKNKGDFFVIPPVYIGNNVQIEKDSIIGPFVSIGDNCLISSGTTIQNSVLENNIYISSYCFIEGSIILDGVSVKRGGVCKNGSVIFNNSIIGENSVICENVFVKENSVVSGNKTIKECCDILRNNNYTENHNNIKSMLYPHKISKLGCAMGTVFTGAGVGIATDGGVNSLSLKYGLLCGLISCGAKTFTFGSCFHSQVFFYEKFCELDFIIYISGNENGTDISIYNKGMPLNNNQINKISNVINNGNFIYASFDKCKNITAIKSIQAVYCNEIIKMFDGIKVTNSVSAFSHNPIINRCIDKCLNRLGVKTENDNLIFKVNETGTKLVAIENNADYSYETLLSLVNHFKQTEIKKFYFENNFLSEEKSNLWQKDAVFLLFNILYVMNITNKSIKELTKELPEYYLVTKVFTVDNSPNNLARNLKDKGFCKNVNGGLIYRKGKNTAKLFLGKDGKSLRLVSQAVSSEIAEELSFSLECMIKSVAIDNNPDKE